jgi:hypothetical protein
MGLMPPASLDRTPKSEFIFSSRVGHVLCSNLQQSAPRFTHRTLTARFLFSSARENEWDIPSVVG